MSPRFTVREAPPTLHRCSRSHGHTTVDHRERRPPRKRPRKASRTPLPPKRRSRHSIHQLQGRVPLHVQQPQALHLRRCHRQQPERGPAAERGPRAQLQGALRVVRRGSAAFDPLGQSDDRLLASHRQGHAAERCRVPQRRVHNGARPGQLLPRALEHVRAPCGGLRLQHLRRLRGHRRRRGRNRQTASCWLSACVCL